MGFLTTKHDDFGPWTALDPLTNWSSNGLFKDFSHGFKPCCRWTETDDSVGLSVDLPGMDEADIKVETTENEVKIFGEREEEVHKGFYNEKTFGSFERRFSLPHSVNVNSAVAEYENGVLILTFKKMDTAKFKKIQVSKVKK